MWEYKNHYDEDSECKPIVNTETPNFVTRQKLSKTVAINDKLLSQHKAIVERECYAELDSDRLVGKGLRGHSNSWMLGQIIAGTVLHGWQYKCSSVLEVKRRKEMTIGEVARRAGVQASTIRYYESIGVLPAPARIKGRRCYTEAIFDRLTIIQLAHKAGFTLTDMKDLLRGFTTTTIPPAQWRPLATRRRAEADALIQRGRRMQHLLDILLTCHCERPEDCQDTIDEILRAGSTPTQ